VIDIYIRIINNKLSLIKLIKFALELCFIPTRLSWKFSKNLRQMSTLLPLVVSGCALHEWLLI
jgi:hypothetical protein